MATASTGVALASSPSLLEVPELVGLIAQYLSSHDIAQCMATCKAWKPLFESFLWRIVELKSYYPAPQALVHNRHRIRSLSVAANDYVNLQTLAYDLPDISSFRGPGYLSPVTPEPLQEPDNLSKSSTARSNTFRSLRVIRFDYNSVEHAHDWKRPLCLSYILRIINQSPGLVQLAPPESILSFSCDHAEPFLYILAHKLFCIKELNIRGGNVSVETGLEFLRVCLNHPQLAKLHCDFRMEGLNDYFSIEDYELFDTFFTTVENDRKVKETAGKPVLGSPIKSLILPKTNEGYPPDFICTLLKSYLLNLEILDIPDIGEEEDEPCQQSFEEAVAQGCPKLRHLRCSWNDDGYLYNIMIGITKGCQEWGLKSFYCRDLDDMGGILGTLLEHHFGTLEEVELMNCHSVQDTDLVELFECAGLEKVKIQQSSTGRAAIELQDVRFGCYDLKELQLTLRLPELDAEQDEFSGADDDDYYDDEDFSRRHELFSYWMRRRATEAYTEIGSLSKLETLSLNCVESENARNEGDFDSDLTLKYGCLRQLGGLKELKHFHMATDFWSCMGQAEVEFMDAQWPKLETIVFSCSDLNAIVEKPHWQWLQRRRPHLRYL
ncbi:MAG: hypothetical protein J3Q66DRAFT_437489 [Benniella sp.]|nr:MAG: hypothetical protein J3Q66DRAFT_437489 [Benniella sp.]